MLLLLETKAGGHCSAAHDHVEETAAGPPATQSRSAVRRVCRVSAGLRMIMSRERDGAIPNKIKVCGEKGMTCEYGAAHGHVKG